MRRFARVGGILLGLWLGPATVVHAQPLRVGIDINGEPMTAVDSKGVPTGFAVEIMNAIAEEMHFPVVYVAKPWDDMFEDFKAGRIDALANVTYTSQRATFIDYTDPHLVMEGAVFVRRGDRRLKTAADLRTMTVALKPGGSPYSYLEAHSWLGRVVPAPTLRDALQTVANGIADATLDARIIGTKNIRDDHLDNLEIAGVVVPEFAQRLHIGLHKGDPRLNTINDGLARLHTNGLYDRIHDKWIGPLQPHRVRLRDLQPYLLPALLVFGAIVAALAWQRRLLRRLARQAAELRQSKEQLTLVLEGSEDGFWDWDLLTGRIERSERWAAMLGYTLSEIEPTLEGGLKLVHPDDLERCRKFRAPEQMRDVPRYDLEFRMKAKSGDWRWILNRGKIVTTARDGTPLRVAGMHTDITNLKRAQEELARQETQFRFIYETAPVGLSWVRRREGYTRLVNPAHERITGVPVAKSRDSANYVEATHPDDRARQRQLSEQLYRGDIEQFSVEKRYVHPDGKIVWAMHTARIYRDPVTHESQEVTTLVDLTELKRADEEREKLRLKMLDSQKLESLGVLAGGIAHDFNNLLTVILANASIARSETDDAAARAQHLTHVETAARRAADLCRQMLAYAGRGSFVIDRVDLGKLLRDTAQLLQVSISKKARLILAPAADLPPVEADISQLQQVVMNLVINASDALGETSGEITLTTRLARPSPGTGGVTHSFDLPDGVCVCVEVSDTGQGMTPATLARVFDPFFTTKFAGRGLGLAAVLGIVRTHHGALTVESTPGRGSRFSLFLPAAAPVVETHPRNTRPPMAPSAVAGTILVADDEPVVLATTDHLLRRFGYKTVLAIDGNEVVRQFRSNPNGFTAVLLDLTMPGLDGVEALREIRKLNPDVPVLLMSGYSEQDMLARIRDQGPVPVLRKPFSHEILLARLAEVIAG
jgi:two-component system, cell cycle sensor histidine kinase and response regulator CckA